MSISACISSLISKRASRRKKRSIVFSLPSANSSFLSMSARAAESSVLLAAGEMFCFGRSGVATK